MALTEAQLSTVITVVGQVFSPKDPALHLLVLTRVGLDMSKIVRLNGTFYDNVIDLTAELQRRRALRVFIQAVLDKLGGNELVQTSFKPLLPDLDKEDANPGQTVALGLSGLQAGVQQDAAVKEATRTLKGSLTDLTQDIFSLHAYKLLHDCLHHLQMQFRRTGNAVRNLQQQDSQDDLAECITQMQSLGVQGSTALNDLPAGDHAARILEQNWLDLLVGIADLAQQALNTSSVSPNLPGIQCLYQLRTLIRVEPPRIDGLLTANASTLALNELEALFVKITALPGADPAMVAALEAGKVSLGQLILQIQALIQQHRRWQEIDRELWAAEEMLPKDALSPGDFPALWSGIRTKADQLIQMEPQSPWAASLQKWADDLDVRRQEDWSKVKIPFNQFRQESIRRFFAIDSNLKMVSQQVASIGTSLRNLLTGL